LVTVVFYLCAFRENDNKWKYVMIFLLANAVLCVVSAVFLNLVDWRRVSQWAEKAVCRSVFLTIWHCILSAEITKTHSFRLLFGDFAH